MRWLFGIIGAVLVLIVAAIGVLFLLPAERIAGIAAQQFEAATGRELTISGDVRPTIWPVLGARVEDVRIANVTGSDNGPFLNAELVDLGVDFWALTSGDLVVRKFHARAPQIILERDAQGRGNWEFGAATGETAAADAQGDDAGLPQIVLESGLIEGASLRFIDHAAGTDLTLTEMDVSLALPESGAASIDISGLHNGTQLAVETRINEVSSFLSGAVVPLAAELTLDGASAQFDGRVGLTPLAAEGRVEFSGSRLASLMALAGNQGAEPLPEAARPLELAGQVTLAPGGSVHLRDGVLRAGEARLALALDLAVDGERPNLTGQITSEALDLRPFLGGGEASGDGGSAESGGWSTERIDASALGALDARVALATGEINTGSGVIDSFRGVFTIDRARAVLEIAEARAFEGSITGQAVANNRSGLSVGGNLQLRDVALLPLLRQAADYERLTGTAALDLQFLGVGQSVDAIMRSLEGQGSVQMGQGEIIGFDLAGMLRNLDASYVGEGNSTIYDRVGGAFTMQNGVLSTQDLALVSRRVEVNSTGDIDLGAQTLALRVIPQVVRDAGSGDSLRVPLLITGPWLAPRFRLDLEGLAEARLQEERERLEQRAREEADRLEAEARARVEREVEERLGVEVQDGQSTEDALREGLETAVEDAVEDGLRRLLGGN